MRWKRVVLPAPLGPMSATSSPGATWRLTPATAWSPPNDFRTSTTSSSVISDATRSAPRPGPPDVRVGALREEEHGPDQEQAVDDEMEPGPPGPGEVDPRHLGERRQDQGAQDRSEKRA